MTFPEHILAIPLKSQLRVSTNIALVGVSKVCTGPSPGLNVTVSIAAVSAQAKLLRHKAANNLIIFLLLIRLFTIIIP